DGDAHRVSADLANGVGAVSDFTMLRSYFERYRAEALDSTVDVALWIGTLADGLLAGTYLAPAATTIWDALAPRTGHLPRVIAPSVGAEFEERGAWYRTNPYPLTDESG